MNTSVTHESSFQNRAASTIPSLVRLLSLLAVSAAADFLASPACAQIGTRFPSEKRIVIDPVTGVPLTFLTTKPGGDAKIYQTHHQWTSDGKWLVFRSNRVPGQAMAVNEETGDLVQVTEGGFTGMLCLADHSMNLYFLRFQPLPGEAAPPPPGTAAVTSAGTDRSATPTPIPRGGGRGGRGGPRGPAQIVRVDVAKLFADSAAGKLKAASEYEKVCGTVPPEMGAVGDAALDPTEDFIYFRVGNRELAAQHLAPGTKAESAFGPRSMGAGPTGLAGMNLKTGLGIVNLRTREMRIAGQTKTGSGLWHVHGSPDGRWAVGDDFARNIYLIDRQTDELILLSADHKRTAADHPHPTFSADSTRIQIQSAMISEDGRAMNICVIPIPEKLLQRTYSTKLN